MESPSATPGELHPVDQAFYDLTVEQRDRAWRTIEALREVVAALREVVATIEEGQQRIVEQRRAAEAALWETYDLLAAGETTSALHGLDAFLTGLRLQGALDR